MLQYEAYTSPLHTQMRESVYTYIKKPVPKMRWTTCEGTKLCTAHYYSIKLLAWINLTNAYQRFARLVPTR